MKLYRALLLMAFLATSLGSGIEMSAQSLKKSDLPDNFPFQVLHEGFAIIRVVVRNPADLEAELALSSLEVRGPGKKRLKRALPTEITPKLMKYFRGGQLGIFGEAHIGRRPTGPELQRVPTIEPGRSSGAIDVSTGGRLREILEHFELSDNVLAVGESRAGFLYLKSKKTGTQLSGSRVKIGESAAIIP